MDYHTLKKNTHTLKSCGKFCRYADTCERANDIVSTVKVKKRDIVKLANWLDNYAVGTAEAEEDFKAKFYEAMESPFSRFNVIKAQTALGKTEIYLDYMLVSLKPCLIAVPTNLLKLDVYKRAVKKYGETEIKKYPEFNELTGEARMEKFMELGSKKVKMTPSLNEIMERPENKDNPIIHEKWRILKILYDSGKHKKVVPMIKRMLQEEDIPILQDYLDDLAALSGFEGHIITTHGMLLHMSKQKLQKYKIIVDEDILNTVFKNKGKIDVYSLINKLKSCNLDSPAVDKLIQAYEYTKNATTKDVIFSLPKVELDKESAAMSWGFDIAAFCETEHFCYCLKDCSIVFIKPVTFPDLKYTVVSATVNKIIYEYYFGKDKVKFNECIIAPYKGELIQYYDRTMSRSYIRDNLRIYFDIEKRLGKMNCITFLEFAGADLIHFGATEGCDFFKGQDLCVIGTYHVPPWMYKLIALNIGIEFDITDDLQDQEVSHNGYKFKFMTYKDEVLRNIQFYIVEGELEQAVGRARLLRYDCTVHLFSNFPLRQARLRRWVGI